MILTTKKTTFKELSFGGVLSIGQVERQSAHEQGDEP